MELVRAVPTESISEKLSVQWLSEALDVRDLRANVCTPAVDDDAEVVGRPDRYSSAHSRITASSGQASSARSTAAHNVS